ncbi:MAG: hypothetical protein ACYC6N_19875 [Pirellulaceae bacterium]
MKRIVLMTALACFALPIVSVAADPGDLDRQILGAWRLQFTAPDGVSRTPVVILGRQYDEYVAWYVGDGKPQPFQDVQLQGDTLVGKLDPQERPDVTVMLESKLTAENQCTGTAKYKSKTGNDAGQWSFTGQRMEPSSFDEQMTWKLHFTTPDNQQHAPTITVVSKEGKRYAWYSGKDHELPARSINVQGDRVEMTISAQSPEGSRVDVTFRGTIEGDNVQGTAEYHMQGDTGSFPFQGKRTS